jgi:geranylgeranyl diphosphate synthase type II
LAVNNYNEASRFGARDASLVFPKIKIPKQWNIKTYMAEQKARIEARLVQLPQQPARESQALRAFQYALRLPGKRFRPLLVLATADLYRKGGDAVLLDAAAAVECVHTASLIFDDLPCMDDGHLRRGQPTTHRIHGEHQAILAGMSLIAEANRLLSSAFKGRKTEIQQRLEALHLLNTSYSLAGLSGGQSEDLLDKQILDLEELESIHAKKTGSLFIACVEIAAVLCDARDQERGWLHDFAKNLGLAFQIQDDLLDLVESDTTGKDQGQDADKTTFANLIGSQDAIALYRELIAVALRNLEPFGESAFHLRALTEIIRERRF